MDSSLAGRKNMARVMCLLKNIVASRRNLELDAEAHNDTAFQQG
jgi:hypothetical protein